METFILSLDAVAKLVNLLPSHLSHRFSAEICQRQRNDSFHGSGVGVRYWWSRREEYTLDDCELSLTCVTLLDAPTARDLFCLMTECNIIMHLSDSSGRGGIFQRFAGLNPCMVLQFHSLQGANEFGI